MSDLDNRRPLASRQTAWAQAAAAALAKAGASPNLISALGVAFAVFGGAALAVSGVIPGWTRSLAFLFAAAAIQGRLICNLLDGMVATEHGLGDSSGPIWNELPDRFSDALFLAGAGYGAASLGQEAGPVLGWMAAVGAVITAYVRELGRGLGQPADFSGPMAKQHRMAALTITCLASMFEPLWHGRGELMLLGLVVIVVGTAWTIARRVRNLAAALAQGK
jgi:phosphatidylglycerophosphate synthase